MSAFIDLVTVEVIAGRGGNGIVAYRREAMDSMGGPAGGSGGRGGHVFFIGDEGKNTLVDLKYNRHIRSKDGGNGGPKGKQGANAKDIYIPVPLGTICYTEDNRLIGEVLHHNETLLIAKGGRGGRGNMSFRTNRIKAPDFAEQGDFGDTLEVRVELQVLADVGLLGYPSVGKSTLVSTITNAKAKVAAYPFTTLNPQLGMVRVDDTEFVMADLPGLIENAHLGVGLGIQFLRHIERCRILVHIVSMDSEDPYQDYLNINKELVLYDESLGNKTQIVVANKMDVEGASGKLEIFKSKLPNLKVYETSIIKKEGIKELEYGIIEVLKEIPKIEPKANTKLYTLKESEESTVILKLGDDGIYDLSGDLLSKLFNRIDFGNDTAVKRFSKQLRDMGVDDLLRKAGIKSGDSVRIFSYEFEYIE